MPGVLDPSWFTIVVYLAIGARYAYWIEMSRFLHQSFSLQRMVAITFAWPFAMLLHVVIALTSRRPSK